MKKKEALGKFFILLLIILFAVCFQNINKEFSEERLMDTHVSVNEAMSELQFTIYSKEEWEDFFQEYKERYLTREIVFDILQKLGTGRVISFEVTGKKEAVDRAEWNHIYEQLIDYLDIYNRVSVQKVVVLDTEENTKSLHTNKGSFETTLPISYFTEWKNYDIYMMEETCIGVITENGAEGIIANAYILEADEHKFSFLFDRRVYEKKANLKGLTLEKGVADLTVQDGNVVKIAKKKDYIEGHLLSYDTQTIEIAGYGKIPHSGRIPVYRDYDIAEEMEISDIILGNMDVKYIIGEQEVCAILITAPAEIAKVRVLLLAEDGDKFRQEVFVVGDGDITVEDEIGTHVIPAGTKINAKAYFSEEKETVILEQAEENLIYFCNENGEKISNGYSGTLEVRQYKEGCCVVNEVDFETYLYSVVPSEMPSNYHPEALKAQAVCARSYAYMQMIRSDLAAYGAHINDSSSYQVYNNIAKTPASIQAVDETKGIVMLHEGEVIEAYYFSTSMGYTDTAEVWNPLEGVSIDYVKRACLNKSEFVGDLSEETEFKAYLAADMSGYDSDIKFYRWQVEADYSGKSEELRMILETRRQASKHHIKFYDEDGEETDSVDDFGKWKCFAVAERSQSGCILELIVYFENGSVKVKNEYNIRKVLGCGAGEITYADNSKGTCGSLLPSAFSTVEAVGEGKYLLCGGGYGHGIGLSQNGANGLAKAGYYYADILNYFYKDIELVDIRL